MTTTLCGKCGRVVEERVTCIIHPVHQKVREGVGLAENVMPKHINSNLVDKFNKTEEEVQHEPERVTKKLQYFQRKFDTSE